MDAKAQQDHKNALRAEMDEKIEECNNILRVKAEHERQAEMLKDNANRLNVEIEKLNAELSQLNFVT